MLIRNLDDLRRDMRARTQDMRKEAAKLATLKPENAHTLRLIADRLDAHMRDYLRG
ncbi:hypothetical protein [Indioceanicola profundi]|uniref:hypothetical protein n=1 Tax=Indioceanicola profundi TaxID=2220096 RepID=UPI0013C4EDBF|nr:hypothetical protein [Indioceanicola profundi]